MHEKCFTVCVDNGEYIILNQISGEKRYKETSAKGWQAREKAEISH